MEPSNPSEPSLPHGRQTTDPIFWKDSPQFMLSLGVLLTLFSYALYKHGLNRMVDDWFETEEYSHGVLIPFVSAFLIWQKKNVLERIPFAGSWWGVALTLFGIAIMFLGNISAITIILQYGFVITLAGLALSYLGWHPFREIWVPLVLLFFMMPLPAVIFQNLSLFLQVISSKLGVLMIRLFGISVHLEGNVIDLGTYQLQVVEACSGLRYLFPLMTLGLIVAYFYQAAIWKKVVIFLSTIPITILMNSFRIGVIGVLVEYWGIAMAEGFLHDFEGWVVFMGCTAILLLEMWALTRFGKEGRPLRQVFGLEFPTALPEGVQAHPRPVQKTYWLTAAIVAGMAVWFVTTPADRQDFRVERRGFGEFPLALGDWRGKTERMEQIYLDKLKLDDYLAADYVNDRGQSINLYMAYYGSQSKGASIHSPRACLPGGGWKFQESSQVQLDGVEGRRLAPTVNRVGMRFNDSRYLVYYWFEMHGRTITDEYLLKWFVFWDALNLDRTDAALVRVMTPLQPTEDYSDADTRLVEFMKTMYPQMDAYVPE